MPAFEDLFDELKKLTASNTSAEVDALTKKQVAIMLKQDNGAAFWSGGNHGFFINLKARLVMELDRRKYISDLEYIRDALQAKFPKAEYKPTSWQVIEIHLNGLPLDLEDAI